MEAFWPGPLTLLLPKSRRVPAIVTAGRPRVGVRMPRHPVARRLIELAGVPVAAPSANSFGRTSPTRAEFVLQDLDGCIDAVIDSGDATLGLESTVVDVCEEPPVLYRPGMVTFQQLQSLCPSLVAYRETQDSTSAPQASPGIGLKHYSPRARLLLLENADAEKLTSLAAKLQAGRRDSRHDVAVCVSQGRALPCLMNGGIWRIRKNSPVACLQDCGSWMRREQASLFAHCPEIMASGSRFATGCLRLPVNLAGIRGFI